MNARILKEVRLIAPSLALGIGAMALTTTTGNPFWCLLVWLLACTILVAAGFAGELVPQGLAFSLTMPVARRQLWREKVLVVGGGLLALTSCLLVVDLAFGPVQNARSSVSWFLLTFPLFAFGVGGALALWTRQPIAMFWLLLLILGMTFAVTEFLVPVLLPAVNPGGVFEWVVVALALTGGFLGRRQFMHFQDDRSEAAFHVLDLGALVERWRRQARAKSSTSARWMLIRKELALQQINFVLAVAMVVFLSFAGLVVYRLSPSAADWPVGVAMLTKMFALFIAFTVGAVAFAEERRNGTSLFNLTLPVRRRTQFRVKLGVALACGLLLSSGGMFLVDGLLAGFGQITAFVPAYALPIAHALLLGPIASLLATLAGAFASSFSRSFLSALCATFVVGMVIWGAYTFFVPWLIQRTGQYSSTPPNALLLLVSLPVLATIFWRRCWRNLLLEVELGTARRQSVRALVLGLVGILLVTGLCFGRVWEWMESAPTEARFGEAPDGALAFQPKVSENGSLAIDAQGRLWQLNRDYSVPEMPWLIPEPKQVGEETDWREVVASFHGYFALKQDGSLWAGGRLADPRIVALPETELQRLRADPEFASGHLSRPMPVFPGVRWRSLARGGMRKETVAIREDGSMWLWGTPGYPQDQPNNVEARLRISNPQGALVQIGTDHDWKQVVRLGGVYFSVQEDGSLWVWGDGNRKHHGLGLTQPSLVPERMPMNEPVAEIFPGVDGGALIVRPVVGNAIVHGSWLLTVQTDSLPEGRRLTPIQWPFVSEQLNPYFENRQLYLTEHGLVLEQATREQRGSWNHVGNNWIAVTHHYGFTRDGSLWKRGDLRDDREPSAGSRLARWLNLGYGQGEQHLLPPRWRMELVELKP